MEENIKYKQIDILARQNKRIRQNNRILVVFGILALGIMIYNLFFYHFF